ncbi:50S ribosomal protein L10 [Candidatus Peregrinibacteria bacterium CG10_big_fil_rev_8_21_14_0_10_36_19]|nr:MAG: 50S ribosomal protein L10 [Candidatus Peregrinibacteria bacterium CG10_big_fil_rev_8_21_14_0_10_36_19]
MPLSKQQKEDIVQEMTELMKNAKSIVFADYQGLSVKDLKDLRGKMREKGVNFQVAKKTLIRLSAKNAGLDLEIPNEVLEGPVGAAFSMEDEISAAKLIHDFGKKNKNLKLRGSILEGKVLSIADTKALAQLPSREELVAKFIYVIKSPISGFHGVLNNTIAGFVRALNAVKEQKEQAV